MPNVLDPNEVIERLKTNETMLDILIQMEDFIDSLDIYAFKNWIEGEIIDGPVVGRYWCRFTLKYPHRMMPDPRGAARLMEHDVTVDYEESTELTPVRVDTPDDFESGTRKPRVQHSKIWLVTLNIPRRFIDEIEDQSLVQYDDDVDIEDVEAANEEGLDNTATEDETEQDFDDGENAEGDGGDDDDLDLGI